MKKHILYLSALLMTFFVLSSESVQAQKKELNQDKNNYYFFKVVNTDFEATIVRVKESLKEQGFGVVSEINMQQKLTQATGKEMDPYIILGACNPKGAYEALQIDAHIGLMLPCNVIVRDLGNNRVEVAAINPVKTMSSLKNKKMNVLAKEIASKLQLVIANL
ncbi:MAG: DUF302 domain-containing protein [Bacteroidales bacterium]|nr:DUF302 domain-containing protein [Bacteroidales bacterium]